MSTMRMRAVVAILAVGALAGCTQSQPVTSAPTPTTTPDAQSEFTPIRVMELRVLAMTGAEKDAFCGEVEAVGLVEYAQRMAALGGFREREAYNLLTQSCQQIPIGR